MSFSDFEDEAKNDSESIRAQLSFQSGYDKHGYVYSLACPLTGSVTYPVRTFRDTKALEQFIAEFTFFRYRGTCPSWYSVLLRSNNFSEEEAFSGTFKGKKYTPEDGKASVMQLLASGELVAHNMGSWVPEKDRNHHLPWPKPSIEEKFLPVTPPRFSFGPHDEPGYVPPPSNPPENKAARNDDANPIITTAGSSEKTSTTLDEEVVPDSTIASASSGQFKELFPVSSLNKRQQAIHAELTQQGSVGQFRKKSVSMNDLRAISQVTGDEYSMFTLGSRRTIIQGYGNEVKVSEQMYKNLLNGNYGKWSGHTHPPGYSIDPGPADRPFLLDINQQRSAIWGDDGHHVFGPLPSDDEMIQSEVIRKQWERIYGN